jgi:hypothetical protein
MIHDSEITHDFAQPIYNGDDVKDIIAAMQFDDGLAIVYPGGKILNFPILFSFTNFLPFLITYDTAGPLIPIPNNLLFYLRGNLG